MVAFYTSITMSYLAKARVLAASVKRHHPRSRFYLVLAEPAPQWLREGVDRGSEPFDVVLPAEQLGIPRLRGWLFGHDVVEACTAVKAPALARLQNHYGEQRVIYLDPDVVVFRPLDAIVELLDDHSIVLTPHCSDAESELVPIVANEISSLAHGVYNLGFLATSGDDEACRLAQWWTRRLYHFCHDDIPRGLFTDQRWFDLVPAQFDRVKILRDPEFNVASWNLSRRHVEGQVPDGLLCNGRPLCFYHFSGINNGIPERMRKLLAPENGAVERLIGWYHEQCRRQGEDRQARAAWHFSCYDDGQPITRAQRLYYRHHEHLHARYPDPFATAGDCYRRWLETAGPGLDGVEQAYCQSPEALQLAARRLQHIQNLRSYKLYTAARRLLRYWNPRAA